MPSITCRECGAFGPELALRCPGCGAVLPSASLLSAPPGRASAAPESLEGQEVGPYRVEGLLGAGAMGVVYRAVDARLLRPVALKILSERLAPDDRARGRMLREARAAASLRSRSVVQILDHGVWRGRPYIAMELLEGRTLRAHLLDRGRLDAEESARWIAQIAEGLEGAHAAGITHRDLKPENVFLAREDGAEVAKILDFGVAKASSTWADVAETRTGALLGTPAYMSPEQVNGSRALDHRSDLWSLAVIAFECMTGRRPFHRREMGALCVQILSDPLPVPSTLAPDLPPSVDAWWKRAAARDPGDRFQSAREMARALAAALRADSVPAETSCAATISPDARVAQGPGRRRAAVVITSAAALAAALAVAWSTEPTLPVAAPEGTAAEPAVTAPAPQTATVAPAQTATVAPAQTATVAPAQTAIVTGPQAAATAALKGPPAAAGAALSGSPRPSPASAGRRSASPPSATADPSTRPAAQPVLPEPSGPDAPPLDPALLNRRD